MKAFAMFVLAVALAAPAAAADQPVTLTLDGRPVDRHGGSAVMRGGVVFADAVDLTKTFNGLVTFGAGGRATITIGANTGTFVPGTPRARINNRAVNLPGAPFVRNGDIYVPLNAFVARMANARVHIDRRRRRADIVVNASPIGAASGPRARSAAARTA